MTPFLEYKLLTPETADPVIIRITGQKARGIPWFIASNGIQIRSLDYPEWHRITRALWIRGSNPVCDNMAVNIPLSDWPDVKQAIRELNEAKG